MFVTAVCVLFLIKLRWPRNKSLYDTLNSVDKSKIFASYDGAWAPLGTRALLSLSLLSLGTRGFPPVLSPSSRRPIKRKCEVRACSSARENTLAPRSQRTRISAMWLLWDVRANWFKVFDSKREQTAPEKYINIVLKKRYYSAKWGVLAAKVPKAICSEVFCAIFWRLEAPVKLPKCVLGDASPWVRVLSEEESGCHRAAWKTEQRWAH